MQTTKGRLPTWKGLERAMDVVRTHGIRTGCERLIGLHRSGEMIFDSPGNSRVCWVPPELEGGPLGRDIILVHNHPVPAPLSIGDLRATHNYEAAGIIATMPDGGWDFAADVDWRERTVAQLEAVTRAALEPAMDMEERGVSIEDYAAVGNYRSMTMLDHAGLVKGRAFDYRPGLLSVLSKWGNLTRGVE